VGLLDPRPALEEWEDENPRLLYPDWTEVGTRVVSGPLGTANFTGRVFRSQYAARTFWSRYTRIIEEYPAEMRWVFRIPNVRLQLPPGEYRVRVTIDPEKFVKVWTQAESITEVAKAMGLSRQNAMLYAARFRQLGVELKDMRNRRGTEVDVGRLNAIIRGNGNGAA
jgi:hypothetical protein